MSADLIELIKVLQLRAEQCDRGNWYVSLSEMRTILDALAAKDAALSEMRAELDLALANAKWLQNKLYVEYDTDTKIIAKLMAELGRNSPDDKEELERRKLMVSGYLDGQSRQVRPFEPSPYASQAVSEAERAFLVSELRSGCFDASVLERTISALSTAIPAGNGVPPGMAWCLSVCDHAIEHYKGPVAMKIRREIAVEMARRSALSQNEGDRK